MQGPSKGRGAFGSRLGFILAASGSAIGLGNIWRFPYVTGQNGGAAFVIVYLICVFLIGAPVMLSEITLGRHTRRDPVGAFKAIAPRGLWKLVGMLGVFTGVAILSFYGVVAGWTVGYFFKAIFGAFSEALTREETNAMFGEFVGNWPLSLGLFAIFLGMTALVVWRGVSGGIELCSKVLMPVLFLLLIILSIRACTLEGAGKGLEFYLKPDFSHLTPSSYAVALGQAFFSLSLGMGAMLTYGSYIGKRDNLAVAAGTVCFFDTLIALLAGLIIFPTLFDAGLSPEAGPGLVFQALPTLFAKMPFGLAFGAGFFLLLMIAALTSTISLLEVPVSYLVDEKRLKRGTAVLLVSVFTFLIGVPSVLANGSVSWLSEIPGLGVDFLSLMSIIFGNYSLTIGSLLLALFVGYKWGIRAAAAEIESADGVTFRLRAVYAFLIRFLCPVAIAVILVYMLWTGETLG